MHKKWTNFLAVCAGDSDLKKRAPFVTMLTTSEHRLRCDWIVTVLAGKTKFLAAGLKKEYPAAEEFGSFYFPVGMPGFSCFSLMIRTFVWFDGGKGILCRGNKTTAAVCWLNKKRNESFLK